MIATWPLTLPQAPAFGYSEQRKRNLASFSPDDAGAPQARNRSTAVPVVLGLRFEMTTAQLAAFDSFYEDDLSDGILPFEWTNPVTGYTARYIFAPDQAPQKDTQDYNYTVVTCKWMRLPGINVPPAGGDPSLTVFHEIGQF